MPASQSFVRPLSEPLHQPGALPGNLSDTLSDMLSLRTRWSCSRLVTSAVQAASCQAVRAATGKHGAQEFKAGGQLTSCTSRCVGFNSAGASRLNLCPLIGRAEDVWCQALKAGCSSEGEGGARTRVCTTEIWTLCQPLPVLK